MTASKLFVLIAVGACLQFLPAYDLYFVGSENEDFDASLDGWYSADPGFPFPHTPGTAEWTSDSGGSVHMSISGSPGNIELLTVIGTTVYPGDTLLMSIYKTNTEGFGEFHLGIGHSSPFSQKASAPGPAGNYEVKLVCNQCYLPGTVFGVWSAVWPGSAEAWVKYVRLIRGGTGWTAMQDPGRHQTPARPSTMVRAYPSPATGPVTLEFGLAQRTSAVVGIYDLTGSLVRRLEVSGTAGANRVTWNGVDDFGRSVAAGTYFYNVKAGRASVTNGKITLAR